MAEFIRVRLPNNFLDTRNLVDTPLGSPGNPVIGQLPPPGYKWVIVDDPPVFPRRAMKGFYGG